MQDCIDRVMPKSWLPNTPGFKFIAILSDGKEQVCAVQRDKNTGMQTGLLDGLPDFVQETLSKWLEDAAHKLIDWNCLEDPDPKVYEEKCNETLLGLRDKAKFEYERIKDIVERAKREEKRAEHYLTLYHTHGFS